jgi:ATP-dependent Lhr-like helicase
MPLAGFHPIVQAWFAARFGAPTEPQRLGWPAIRSGRDTLVAAPTGSGKTLAAFLSALDDLFQRGWRGELGDETAVVYVSPLKALSNDVQKNLLGPLDEIREAAAGAGLPDVEVRVAVRTGDTPARERAAMLRRPPHVLVTTPEFRPSTTA